MTSAPPRVRALLFAKMIRDGLSKEAVAKSQGLSVSRVHQIMGQGCPPEIAAPARNHRVWTKSEERDVCRWRYVYLMTEDEIAQALDRTPASVHAKLAELPPPRLESFPDRFERPAWSYPDAALVKVCHEIRGEIQRNLRAREANRA
jgi:hypothetical protein